MKRRSPQVVECAIYPVAREPKPCQQQPQQPPVKRLCNTASLHCFLGGRRIWRSTQTQANTTRAATATTACKTARRHPRPAQIAATDTSLSQRAATAKGRTTHHGRSYLTCLGSDELGKSHAYAAQPGRSRPFRQPNHLCNFAV